MGASGCDGNGFEGVVLVPNVDMPKAGVPAEFDVAAGSLIDPNALDWPNCTPVAFAVLAVGSSDGGVAVGDDLTDVFAKNEPDCAGLMNELMPCEGGVSGTGELFAT